VARHPRPVEVHTITSAPASQHDDLGLRMRKYLISMSVRTVCFVLAVVFEGPVRWVFLAAAVVLPYVAVVMANAGPRRVSGHQAFTPEPPAVDDGRRGRLDP
jgi:hypothetical protein